MNIMATIAYCIVGCNTGAADQQTLHVLECDTETGAAKIVQTVKGYQGTTYFQLSADRKALYSVIGEKRDVKTVGSVVKFALDGHKIGEMKVLATLPCETPCHVAFAPDFSLVSTASYCGRTACAMKADGSMLQSVVLPNDEVGPRKDRQQQAYAHCTLYTPDGKYLAVIDLGCDRILFYDVAALKAGKGFKEVARIKADPGDGPRHAVFSKDGKYLFVLNELGSSVMSYRYDAEKVAFTRICKLSMVPEGTEYKATKAAAIKLTADGKMLMASNRGHDSIAFYDVAADGSLCLRNIAPLTGKFPRDFELMPGEKFMVVGHKMSNEIQIYAFDRAKATLTPVGKPVACHRPLCFKF